TDKIINGFLYPRMLRIDQYTHIGFVASFTYTVNTLHDACIFGFFGFAEFLFGLYFSKKVETSQPRWLEHTKRDIFIDFSCFSPSQNLFATCIEPHFRVFIYDRIVQDGCYITLPTMLHSLSTTLDTFATTKLTVEGVADNALNRKTNIQRQICDRCA